jgi:flagellar hook assembly protein FlgD
MSQVNAWKLLSGWFGSKARAEEEETTSPSLPKVFSLSQNYPNPFNPMTTIQYSIPEGISNREMKLAIFNVRGQVVRSIDLGNKMEPGVYMYTWEGRDDRGGLVPSGIYFYMLTSEEKSLTRRMLLLR